MLCRPFMYSLNIISTSKPKRGRARSCCYRWVVLYWSSNLEQVFTEKNWQIATRAILQLWVSTTGNCALREKYSFPGKGFVLNRYTSHMSNRIQSLSVPLSNTRWMYASIAPPARKNESSHLATTSHSFAYACGVIYKASFRSGRPGSES